MSTRRGWVVFLNIGYTQGFYLVLLKNIYVFIVLYSIFLGGDNESSLRELAAFLVGENSLEVWEQS